jgi:tetratricopeptide (TPR) repeat protein
LFAVKSEPVPADMSTQPIHPRRRLGARWWRPLGFIAALLMLALPAAPAAAQASRQPWQILMDAATEANLSNDFATAEALLGAALELSLQTDPKGPRPVLSRLMLQLIYADLKKPALSQRLGSSRLDVSTFDPTLLLFAGTLDRLANKYYDRWAALRDAGNSDEIRSKRSLLLAESERCTLIKWAIQNKLLPATDVALASTIGFHGLVFEKQWKLADAIAKYEAAVKIWDAAEDRRKRLMTSSAQFSLFSGRGSGAGEQTDNPISVKFLLARAHIYNAEEHLEKKKEAEADAAFKRAEPLLFEMIELFEHTWPDHPRAAVYHAQLGTLYFLQRRYAHSEAAYRKSLAIHERNEGSKGDNTRFVVQRLAKLLRSDNREREAVELEERYGVQPAPGK